MTDEFNDLLKRESLANLSRILQAEERQLAEVKNRLYNSVHVKYKVLREASDALLKIHKHLATAGVDCEAVLKKMASLESSKLTVSCPDFDELAASLQDSLIRSLRTVWIEPLFDPQRYRYMTDSPKQLFLAKKPQFDAPLWVKAAEDLAQTLAKSDRPNIPALILNTLESIRIDEHALSNSSLNNFTYTVKRLDEHEDLFKNILYGYTSYAQTKYLEPLARWCAEDQSIQTTPCGSLILISLISLRIILDLHKIHFALPEKLHEVFVEHINAYSDTVLARQLLDSVCRNEVTPTAASLKWYLKVTDCIGNDFPIVSSVWARTCAHTICNVMYKIFEGVGRGVLSRLLDIAGDPEHQSQISDVTDKVSRLQVLLLEACSAHSDHCKLVGHALNNLLKLIWIGFLVYIDPDLDYNAIIAEELSRKSLAPPGAQNVLLPRHMFDICAPLAQNMTNFMSKLQESIELPVIELSNLSNQDRACLIDSARILLTLEESAARDSIAFRLHNWDCKNLKKRFLAFQETQQALLIDSLAEQMARYFSDAFTGPSPDIQNEIVEPIVGLISQINYFCSQIDRSEEASPKRGTLTSRAKLLSELVKATQDERITSLKVEASVRLEDNLRNIAAKQCSKKWRERIILEAFLRAIRKLHHEKKLGFTLNEKSKVLFIQTVTTLCDYVVPAGRAMSALTTDYLSGMIAMICAPNASLKDLESLLKECSNCSEN